MKTEAEQNIARNRSEDQFRIAYMLEEATREMSPDAIATWLVEQKTDQQLRKGINCAEERMGQE